MRTRMGIVAVGAALAAAGCAGEAAERPPARTAQPRAEASNEASITPERADAIDRLFARKAGDLQSCWTEEYERTKNRKLEGDVTLQMRIDPGGHAQDVRVLKSSLGNADVESCVMKAVSGWAFPEGPGAVPYLRTVHLGAQF